MANIRDWLQLFRSHTSPLEMTITITGSALAIGTVWDLKVLLFLIFGWLYHNAGYGHNSVEDFIRGYDKGDPNKAHHPLQRGAIQARTGRIVTVSLILISFIYGAAISSLSLPAMTILFFITVMGLIYNIYNKRTDLKFVPIALAHSLLFMFAFIGSGGRMGFEAEWPFVSGGLGPVAILCTIYLVLQIFYQIMIEGDLKDIEMDEASLLKRLGVRFEKGRLISSTLARTVSISLKLLSLMMLLAALCVMGASVYVFVVFALMSIVIMFMEHRLMGSGTYDHSRSLNSMSVMEVLSTFILVIALGPETGGWPAVVLVIALNIIYFVGMNRFLWGTVIKPRV